MFGAIIAQLTRIADALEAQSKLFVTSMQQQATQHQELMDYQKQCRAEDIHRHHAEKQIDYQFRADEFDRVMKLYEQQQSAENIGHQYYEQVTKPRRQRAKPALEPISPLALPNRPKRQLDPLAEITMSEDDE